jgi:hypothetical protein
MSVLLISQFQSHGGSLLGPNYQIAESEVDWFFWRAPIVNLKGRATSLKEFSANVQTTLPPQMLHG